METWKLKGSVTHTDASTLQEEKEFCTIDIWSEFLTEVNVTEESSTIWKAVPLSLNTIEQPLARLSLEVWPVTPASLLQVRLTRFSGWLQGFTLGIIDHSVE